MAKTVKQLEAEIAKAKVEDEKAAQAAAAATEASRKASRVVEKLKAELAELTSPFKVGDIVEDETGTRFRVTRLNSRTWDGSQYVDQPAGIRLNKNGSEAYKDPRPIYSPNLTVIPPDKAK